MALRNVVVEDHVHALAPDVPERLSELIGQALEFDRARRPPSAAALLEALDTLGAEDLGGHVNVRAAQQLLSGPGTQSCDTVGGGC